MKDPLIMLKAFRALTIATGLLLFIGLSLVAPGGSANVLAASAGGLDTGHIIDDAIFTNKSSMSVTDIQNFLNTRVPVCDTNGDKIYSGTLKRRDVDPGAQPYTCVKGYREHPVTHENNLGGKTAPAGSLSAAEIIWNAAQNNNINPQVLLVTLQKETALVNHDWPSDWRYRTAMGYGCPDPPPGQPPTCDQTHYGFYNQVNKAAWQFRRYIDRPQEYNYGVGNRYVLWHPDASRCGGKTISIKTAATAALYNYTPYQPNSAALNAGYGLGDSCSSYGNRNFFLYFSDWFGPTIGPVDYSCKNATNVSGASSGRRILNNRVTGKADSLSLVFPNHSSSACIEIHTWGSGQQTWINNVATNHPAINPADTDIITGDTNGDGKDELIFIKYRNSGSGKIEVHTWDPTYQRWFNNIATNHPAVNPADTDIITGDTNGDGKDELIFIKYRNSGSGKIEVHTWAPGQQTWISNIATNHPIIDPANNSIISADTNGDKVDELIFVKYQNNGSGKIEVHTWAPGQQTWISNIATNHTAVSPEANGVISADTNGDGRDELIFIRYSVSGSGRIEVHTWLPGQQGWYNNIATNHPTL